MVEVREEWRVWLGGEEGGEEQEQEESGEEGGERGGEDMAEWQPKSFV